MQTQTVTTKRVTSRRLGLLRILGRVALVTGVVLITGIFIAHEIFKKSGSGEWKLEDDKGGIKVYSRKSPGNTLKQFKAVTQVKSTLSRVVAAMNDDSTQNCKDWMPVCASLKPVELWNPQTHYSITYFRLDLPFPFSPRDIVYKTQVSQDPQSKAVTIALVALQGMVPVDKCCVRVTQIHNRWLWTPLKDGEIELQLFTDMDAHLPYFLANNRGRELRTLLTRMPKLLDKPQYQNEKFDFIQEPAS